MPRSSLYSPEEFLLRMKKKPALQVLLDTLMDHDVEYLKNVSGQPLWIREALVKLRLRGGIPSSVNAEKIADSMDNLRPDERHLPREVREWIGPSVWWSTGGQMDMEICSGNLLMLYPAEREIKVDYIVIPLTPAGWQAMMQNTKPVGNLTFKEYGQEIQNRLSRKHG